MKSAGEGVWQFEDCGIEDEGEILRYAGCVLVGMLHLEALDGLMLGKAWGKMEFWE